jgi:hypothetical protein
MQIAAGRKKYTPGVGTELAKQGLVGTRGMMQGQTRRGLERSGRALSETAENIDQPIAMQDVAQEVWNKASAPRLQGVGIKPSAADKPDLMDMAAYVEDIASRGNVPATQGVGYARAAGDRAFQGREVAGAGLQKKLSKYEQKALSDAIKKADPSGKYAKEASTYGALKRAEKSLNEEVSLPRSLMGLASQPIAAIPGAAIAPSLVGQASTRLAPAVQRSTPASLEAFLEGLRKK